MDFRRFLWFFMDLRGSGARTFGGLCRPVVPSRAGLDPPNIKISDSGGLDLEAWCLDAWMLKDWNGLEEVTEVTAFWGEGIGRNSHTLKLQELGGYANDLAFGVQIWVSSHKMKQITPKCHCDMTYM